MTVTQDAFRHAVIDPRASVPPGLQDAKGDAAGRRFDVYRNNVAVSLIEALQTAFPLVRKIIGQQTFDALAGVFLRAHPPSSPLMMHYGGALPDFLTAFAPLKHIGYLPDCAKLDLALRRSYHAADADPIGAAALQDPDLGASRFDLAPATQVIGSAWPLFDIWRFNTQGGAPKPRAVAQDVMIARPEYDPQVVLLPPGAAEWLDHIRHGQTFANAHEMTLTTAPDFDLGAVLTLTLQTGAIIPRRQEPA